MSPEKQYQCLAFSDIHHKLDKNNKIIYTLLDIVNTPGPILKRDMTTVFILQLYHFELPIKGGSNKLQCYLVMDLIKHFLELIHVERQKKTLTV